MIPAVSQSRRAYLFYIDTRTRARARTYIFSHARDCTRSDARNDPGVNVNDILIRNQLLQQ